MTTVEFDVLDELYFITGFDTLQQNTKQTSNHLSEILFGLYQKGWIRCYKSPDQETKIKSQEYFESTCKYLYFLASKKGLLAHNRSE